jgi:hypothetical protein
MLKTLSPEEMLDALAFYEIDMPGERRADMRSMVAAICTAGGTKDDPPRPIYPYYGESIEDQIEDEEEIEFMMEMQDEYQGPDEGLAEWHNN